MTVVRVTTVTAREVTAAGLTAAGMATAGVTTTKVGRARVCRLSPHQLEDATEWLDRYRDLVLGRLDRFAELLDREKGTER